MKKEKKAGKQDEEENMIDEMLGLESEGEEVDVEEEESEEEDDSSSKGRGFIYVEGDDDNEEEEGDEEGDEEEESDEQNELEDEDLLNDEEETTTRKRKAEHSPSTTNKRVSMCCTRKREPSHEWGQSKGRAERVNHRYCLQKKSLRAHFMIAYLPLVGSFHKEGKIVVCLLDTVLLIMEKYKPLSHVFT